MINNFEVHCGDVFEVLANLKIKVNTVITSPPYFHKRKYGSSSKELGQEKSIKAFAHNLCKVFTAIPLEDRGSIWVNLGDKRNSSGGLQQIPEIFALYMANDYGFELADKVVWAKVFADNTGSTQGAAMPEPALGRLNGNGHEIFYRFVKTKKVSDAWTDTCAVRLPRQEVSSEIKDTRYLPESLMSVNTSIEGRNLVNVWRCQMGQIKAKHYAAYPESLVERAVAMTCPLVICTQCNHLQERIIEMVEYDEGRGSKRVFGKYNNPDSSEVTGRQDSGREYVPRKPVTVGWSKCKCQQPTFEPGIVLDPFCGSGTTGAVALKMGRRFIGIDLYPEFVELSKKRCQDAIDYLTKNNLDPLKLYK